LFRGKIFVFFCWLGLEFITICLLFLYNFCHSAKKLTAVSPFRSGSIFGVAPLLNYLSAFCLLLSARLGCFSNPANCEVQE
jgi:hypothetical protein